MQIQESVVQEAIEKTGFGKFNFKVSILGALLYANGALTILSIGYVLPAAVCDFEMTTIDKGRMASAPVLGSVLGSLFWGFLADLKGRRTALIVALLVQSNVDIFASFVSNYWAFLFLKVISGFAVIGQITPLFSYVGEFQPVRHRKQIQACLGFVMVTSLIILPLFAWAIIPMQFEYRNHYFFFRSWNLFVLICALPAEILGIWIIFYPETPKYLGESGKIKKLMKVLTDMYVENTGGLAEEYIAILSNSRNDALLELVHSCRAKSISAQERPSKNFPKNKDLRSVLNDFKLQGKNTIKAPHLKNLVTLSICMFCLGCSCYPLITWFPDIFQRFAEFEILHPNETTNFCSISHSALNTTKDQNFESSKCKQTIDTNAYQHSLWLGLSTAIPNILYLLLIDKLGFKFFTVSCFVIGIGTSICFFFSNSLTQNIILACILQAITCTSLSVMYSFNVVLFPTNIRLFSSTVSVFCSRLGIILGNVIITYLIDDYCTILIGSIIVQLSIATVLGLTLRG